MIPSIALRTSTREETRTALVDSETLALLMDGLVIGTAAALLSIGPALIERDGHQPALSVVWLAADRDDGPRLANTRVSPLTIATYANHLRHLHAS